MVERAPGTRAGQAAQQAVRAGAPLRGLASAARLNAGHWSRLTQEAREVEHKLGGNNPYDVRDDYYKQYLASLYSPARNEFANVDPLTRTELATCRA